MRVNNLRYNAYAYAFEATVDVDHDGRIKTYPCWVYGPRNLDTETVTRWMCRKAIKASQMQSGSVMQH